jgi:3'-phosphoadenosine 5'-phosphosulfate sulfotransferase (PAPS reductase)/FAD synthetase
MVMTQEIPYLKEVLKLRNRGALFVVNDSGGKDSQCMKIVVSKYVPAAQIVVIHAHLPGVEHPGTAEHAKRFSEGLAFSVVQAKRTLLQMIRERRMFPSPSCRQCTSDLKRGPIEKAIRHRIRQFSLSGLVVNCMGIRAEESPHRAKAIPFKFNKRNSKAGREWYDWLPIHEFKTHEVFSQIRAAGQKPHPIYSKGMTRLSCCFCIMASKTDLIIAAQLYPGLYKTYVRLEQEIGFTMQSGKTLVETTGIKVGR